MENTLPVSGNSPVLKWLVAACTEAAPWLSVSADHLRIDWDMALARRRQMTGREDLSPSLSAVLMTILPVWPLSRIREWHDSAWRDGLRESLTTRMALETISIPADVRTALDSVAAALDKLVIVAHEELAKKSRNRLSHKTLEDFCRKLQSLSDATQVQFLQRDLVIRYHLGQRLAVAKGDMTIFLRGSSASYYFDHTNSDMHRRAESWRLARRLLRAHTDFYEQLEAMVLSSVPDQSDWVSNPMLSESWRRLGNLEQSLARSLIAAPKQRGGRQYAEFVDFEQGFKIQRDAPKSSPRSDSPSRSFYGAQSPMSSPLGVAIASLDQVSAALKTLRIELHQYKYDATIDNSEAAVKAATDVLCKANRRMGQEMSEQLSARELDDALNWLIAESPLLTLLASGFLSFYAENSKRDRYGISLSPWLVATIMAKKFIGTQPMTYLGIDTCTHEDDAENDGNPVSEGEKHRAPISGRRLWELVQTSLA